MAEPTTTLIPTTIEGSADKGGWEVSADIINDHDEVAYGRHVELYVKPEGGGGFLNYHLAINGSMLPQSVLFDRRMSRTSVRITTSNYFLENAGLQGIYFTKVTPSTNPHQIPGLNLGKIVQHLVEEHTNISISKGGWVDTTGIDTVGSTSVEVYTVRESNSIWNTIQQIAENEFYVRYFTKKDELIYQPHPQFDTSLQTPVLTLNESVIVGQPEIIYRTDVKTDQVNLYGLTDTGTILRADYPANVGTEARKQRFTNLRCNSQGRLEQLAQRAYKFLNRNYNIRLSLVGPWGTYLELYDRVQVTYTGTYQNGLNIDWNEKKFWVSAVRVERMGSFAAITELELEEEVL